MPAAPRRRRPSPPAVARRVEYERLEDVVGCKWSVAVVMAVAQGEHRPGRLEQVVPGISTKVLNERLRKLVNFGILQKTVFAGKPPRTDYTLTPKGTGLVRILEQLHALAEPPSPVLPDKGLPAAPGS